MPYNRIRLGTKESASLGVIVQRMQFAYEHRTLLYPAVKGLHCAFGGTAWLIEQSQFGLAIRMWLKETNFHHSCKFSKAFFDFIRTLTDIDGHWRTLRFGDVLSLHGDSGNHTPQSTQSSTEFSINLRPTVQKRLRETPNTPWCKTTH